MTHADSKRAVLIILDGFGIGKSSRHNAIANAQMPFYTELLNQYPHSQLLTHGEAVGLPEGIMGNSEVGHTTMGSGRIIYQDLVRISRTIKDKKLHEQKAIKECFTQAAEKGRRVHLMGLLSDGGVHSHMEHLLGLLDLCAELRVPKVSVHAFLDGRDTPPNSSPKYLKQLLKHPTFQGQTACRAVLATMMGRYWAMDRDKRWERIDRAMETLLGKANVVEADPVEIVEKFHQAGKSDEFIEPVLLDLDGVMRDQDTIFFFNYRADRARQLTTVINRKNLIKPAYFSTMTQYDERFTNPVAFAPQKLNKIFGELLERKHKKQFRIAETEKYAHVTFFFNGGREEPFVGEERVLVPSPKDVATYDLKPEMSAGEIASTATDKIESKKFDFVLMNFANPDMVGHTGKYEAAIKAMNAVDNCLEKVIGMAEKSGYHTIITADHGNAEEMEDHHGNPHTQHTLNPVPTLWVAPNTANAPKEDRVPLNDGTLADIMPTLCELMGLESPSEMTGQSLISKGEE